MHFLTVLFTLCLMMFVSYYNVSVILFVPIAELLTLPAAVPPTFAGVFMEQMAGFIRRHLPVFLLGAVFGKVIAISGFSKAIVRAVIGMVGTQ